MKTYRIKIYSKWISKDNILMLTYKEEDSACLNEVEMLNLKYMLCGYGDKIKIIEVYNETNINNINTFKCDFNI